MKIKFWNLITNPAFIIALIAVHLTIFGHNYTVAYYNRFGIPIDMFISLQNLSLAWIFDALFWFSYCILLAVFFIIILFAKESENIRQWGKIFSEPVVLVLVFSIMTFLMLQWSTERGRSRAELYIKQDSAMPLYHYELRNMADTAITCPCYAIGDLGDYLVLWNPNTKQHALVPTSNLAHLTKIDQAAQ